MATTLQDIYEDNAARIHSQHQRRRSQEQQHNQTVELTRGASDLLDIATRPAGEQGGWCNLRDFIASHGDRTIHFSAEGTELQGNAPIPRYIVLTENGIYRFPRSCIETGIFYDCRTPLAELTQVIVRNAYDSAGAADVGRGEGGEGTDGNTQSSSAGQYYLVEFLRTARSGTTVIVGFTLSFTDVTRRKALLMSLCSQKPTLPIMQKRKVPKLRELNQQQESSAKKKTAPSSPEPNNNNSSSASTSKRTTPRTPRTPGRATTSSSVTKQQGGGSTSATRKQQQQQGREASPLGDLSSISQHQQQPPPEIDDESFSKFKDSLRDELLDLSAANMDLGYDYDKVTQRPSEEDAANKKEREEIRAMLEAREAKMVRSIEFKIKYPHKIPTRVPPGVEFDKAHEERMVLPDNFSDMELLGPSLHPLWVGWKRTNGLSGNDGLPKDWTLYDSTDLIESLRTREDALFGVIGKTSAHRLGQMRELVERERQMFLNRMIITEGPLQTDTHNSSFAVGSPSRSIISTTAAGSNSKNVTRPVPFNLSKSPSAMRKMKIIDSEQMIAEMKTNFEMHLQVMHELRKEQLLKEVEHEMGGEGDG